MDSREGSSRPSSLEQAERDSTVIVKREVDDRNGEEEEEEEDSGSDEEDDDDDHDNADNEFAVAVQLKKPSLERRTLEQIVSLLNSPYLDLNPPYQREVLTDVCQVEDRMSALVGSIYDNFYVPPVIFNVETVVLPGPEGGVRFKRVCVDGKQRLTSVKAFLDGEIPVKDANYKSWYYQASLNHRTGQPIRNRKVLSERLKKQFREKSLICIEFDGLSREQEEDLFARVQKGMPLNPAEKFRATRGPWQEFATLFEHDFCDVMMLSGNKRSSGWRNLLACFSQVIEVLYSQGDVPKLRTSHQNIAKLLEAEASCDEGIKSHLRRVFTKFASIVRARPDLFKDHNFTRVKTFSPVELVGVTVLISKYPKRNTHMLYGDILYLRKELRLVYRDLKLNLDTWRAVWHLITTLESVRGAADGSTTMKARRSNGTEMEVQHEGQDDDDSDYEDAAPLSASPVRAKPKAAPAKKRGRPKGARNQPKPGTKSAPPSGSTSNTLVAEPAPEESTATSQLISANEPTADSGPRRPSGPAAKRSLTLNTNRPVADTSTRRSSAKSTPSSADRPPNALVATSMTDPSNASHSHSHSHSYSHSHSHSQTPLPPRAGSSSLDPIQFDRTLRSNGAPRAQGAVSSMEPATSAQHVPPSTTPTAYEAQQALRGPPDMISTSGFRYPPAPAPAAPVTMPSPTPSFSSIPPMSPFSNNGPAPARKRRERLDLRTSAIDLTTKRMRMSPPNE